MKIFDSNIIVGMPLKYGIDIIKEPIDLINKIQPHGIVKALVSHYAQCDGDAVTGNNMLSDFISGYNQFYGVWAMLPSNTNEIDYTEFFQKMKEKNIRAVTAYPIKHNFILNRIVMGDLLDEISERGIPFVYHMNETRDKWIELYKTLEEFPKLTCIITDIGIWGVDRYTWPLLSVYKNVYLETSMLSIEAGGLETATNKFGSERLVYGSGYMRRYPEASMMDLLHSSLTDKDKENIAYNNFANILNNERL